MQNKVQVVIALAICVNLLSAHKPLQNPETSDDYRGAIEIEDPEVSYVVYHEITKDRPRVWLKLEAEAGYNLYVSLGVPVIERLKKYKPAVAVIGPGLPNAEFSFPVPGESGAWVFSTDTIDEPRFFHEPVTGTDSWIYVEEWVTLPETGTYYVVAYHPEDTHGKLWIAPGTEEKWNLIDILTIPGMIQPVRKFHEVR